MEQLYALTINSVLERQNLYLKLHDAIVDKGIVVLQGSGSRADFLTYFNSFSVAKWKHYSTLKKLIIKLEILGTCKIIFKGLNSSGCFVLFEENISTGTYIKEFSLESLACDILGFELHGLEKGSSLQKGSYWGDFSSWKSKNIGVVICTFKREQYIKKTVEKLQKFSNVHSWLYTIVVDNGATLPELVINNLRVLHNPNYGGSGGFTRGIIETIKQNISDYVLLMDDDIDIDTTVIDRAHSLLCGLKEEYDKSYLAGAMLRIDKPGLQFERCAYWSRIHLKSLGQGLNLFNTDDLCTNEVISKKVNIYAGWWFCGMPVKRIKEVGYPLPVFIKGDDIEYGIRNGHEFITLNGIGVWHELFAKKASPEINYFSDRNMLIVNNFATGCGMLTFSVAVVLRLLKRLFFIDKRALEMYDCAITDYCTGLEGITSEPPFKKMQQLKSYRSNKNVLSLFFSALLKALKAIYHYRSLHKKFVLFRQEQLKDDKFWLHYLGLG